MAEWIPDGTDDQLHELLRTEYACTRSWEAWQYGTMTQADFTPMGETEIVGDLLAWRDAAVRAAFDAMLPPGLDERVAEITAFLKTVSVNYFDYGRLHDERADLKRIRREHDAAVQRALESL